MTRLLLVAAALVAVLAAAGVGAGAEWHAHLGGGHADSGCDLRRRGGGYDSGA